MKQVYEPDVIGKTIKEVLSLEDDGDRQLTVLTFTDDTFAAIEGWGGDCDSGTSFLICPVIVQVSAWNKDRNDTLVKLGLVTREEVDAAIEEYNSKIEEARARQIEESRSIAERFPTLASKGIV